MVLTRGFTFQVTLTLWETEEGENQNYDRMRVADRLLEGMSDNHINSFILLFG